MSRTDEPPFELHLLDATHEEAGEAERRLDLAEDGLDDLLAQAIATPIPGPVTITCEALSTAA